MPEPVPHSRYVLPTVDGGFTVFTVYEGWKPDEVLAVWFRDHPGEYTGAKHLMSAADYDAYKALCAADNAYIRLADGEVVRKYRSAWRFNPANRRFSQDANKKAEIDGRPAVKSIEERMAALESKAARQ